MKAPKRAELRSSMQAVQITKFGPPKVLQIREMPIPEVHDGDVMVRVKAIGINFADVFARLGYYPGIPKPPFVPGIEFCGIVECVGKSVRIFKRGDRVLGFSRQTAYAEFVSVPSELLNAMPRSMSFEDAAAFGVTALTAYHALITLGQIAKGETVLLHAAAGGVGTAALQVARHLGAKVYATVGSNSKIQVAQELGAFRVINYVEEDFAEVIRRETKGKGVDIVLDSVGGRVLRKGWKLLAPMGRYVLFGFAAVADKRGVPAIKALIEVASTPLIYPQSIVNRNVSLMGFNLYFLLDKVAFLQKTMSKLLGWYEKGIVKPVIGAVYPFDKIQEAHEFLQSRRSVGKVVVTLGGE